MRLFVTSPDSEVSTERMSKQRSNPNSLCFYTDMISCIFGGSQFCCFTLDITRVKVWTDPYVRSRLVFFFSPIFGSCDVVPLSGVWSSVKWRPGLFSVFSSVLSVTAQRTALIVVKCHSTCAGHPEQSHQYFLLYSSHSYWRLLCLTPAGGL